MSIGNYNQEKIKQKIFNRFSGSLEPLKNLTKLRELHIENTDLSGSLEPLAKLEQLEKLDISDTDLNSGVEHLPESLRGVNKWKLKKISYVTYYRPNSEIKKIKNQLDLFTNKEWTKWKSLGFSLEEIMQWTDTDIGLTIKGSDFANFLKKGKNLTPWTVQGNLNELWKEYHQAQKWIDYNYLPEQRVSITELNISNQNLWGDLDLKDFSSLEKLDCSNNQLIGLNLNNNLRLSQLFCSKNQLTSLDLSSNASLVNLACSNNKFTNLDLGHCENLTGLDCSHNPLIEKLDLRNNLKLTELNCSNGKENNEASISDLLSAFTSFDESESQLSDIIFSPDFESFKLERIDITGNDKLDCVAIDERFLKRLPGKLDYQIPAISSQELEQVVRKKANIPGEIKDIYFFSPWWNPNCALVVNKAFLFFYGVRLVVYEPLTEGQRAKIKELEKKLKELVVQKGYSKPWKKYYEDKIKDLERNIKKILINETFKVIKVSEHIYKDKVEKKIQELKQKLDSDNPILAIYSQNFNPHEVIERAILPKKTETKPDKYLTTIHLTPTDLIWRTMNIPGIYHVAIYLGNNRVAHIGSSKFVKASKMNAKSNKGLLGARNDHWLDFLKDTKELVRYRPIIPFKRPEKIREHISQAILAEYGQQEYDFLGNNCEHFATRCVFSIPFSTQADKISLLAHRVYWDLTKEINESEAKFNQMGTQENFRYETNRLKEYFEKKIEELASKEELTTEEQQQLTNLKAEKQSLEELQVQQPQTQQLTELKRYAKNKIGYTTLEDDALAKVERIKVEKQKEESKN